MVVCSTPNPGNYATAKDTGRHYTVERTDEENRIAHVRDIDGSDESAIPFMNLVKTPAPRMPLPATGATTPIDHPLVMVFVGCVAEPDLVKLETGEPGKHHTPNGNAHTAV